MFDIVRPTNGLHHRIADTGEALSRPDDRIPETQADQHPALDDIVRPELRNDVMLTGNRAVHVDPSRVSHGKQRSLRKGA